MAIGSKARQRLTTRLGLGSSGLAMTPVEFDALPDRILSPNLRYELVNGVLIVAPPRGNAEIGPSFELGHLVWYYRHYHPLGSIVDAVLPEQTIYATPQRRRADHAIWLGLGRVPNVEVDIPAIVVEFVSAKKRDFLRDYETKRGEYMAIGIREYWIIDRFARIMTVHRNRPEGIETRVVAEAETYQTDLLPGFTLPLARLLARADDWASKTGPKRKRNPPRKPTEGEPR